MDRAYCFILIFLLFTSPLVLSDVLNAYNSKNDIQKLNDIVNPFKPISTKDDDIKTFPQQAGERSIKKMSMVGTISYDGNIIGIIDCKTDGLYSVSKGDIVGSEKATIIDINHSTIQMTYAIKDKRGQSRTKEFILKIQEK